MSEPVLKAIIKLFALVAKEDTVTKQEREFIEVFLSDHLNQKSVKSHLQLFDEYARESSDKFGVGIDQESITKLCQSINREVDYKQKSVIMLELMSLILADGNITPSEENLAKSIGQAFNVSSQDIELIKIFIVSKIPELIDNENILVVSNEGKSGQGTKVIKREELDGFMSVLHLKSSNLFFFRYLGHSDVYLNGVPQKPGNINVLATGSIMRWGAADAVYYGEILNKFKSKSNHSRTSFEAEKISYRFKTGKFGLRKVTISTESGNLVALMGASGAGKSTLLHVLNGTEKPFEGKVLINGIDIHKNPEKIEGVIGFVPQDDLLIEDLTVYQNLYFAAKLCFSHLEELQIDELVIKTLEDLGLTQTKDLKVGSPLQKTISGGQRKRLNIGLELLREPAVLFVDEPTSGLSSRDSENIIDLLKELSLKGKLVFAVIHQPSSDIFKMFDKLVILDTGGYQIYFGNPVDAVTYFKRNIHLINSDEGECHACGNVNPEQIFNIIETKVINEFGDTTNERKFSPEQWNEIFSKQIKIRSVLRANEIPHSTLHIPSWFKQTRLFSMRDVLSKISNKQYLIINLFEAPMLAFILAFIVRYYNVNDPFKAGYVFSKNLNLPAHLFMSIIVALFMGLTVSAEEIIRDRKILKREKFLHLNRSSYIISKISILFIISALQTALFVAVANYILQIQGVFFIHWGILFTVSCFANLLGLNISSAFNSAVTIYILIPILLIPQLILSGVVVKFDKLNPLIGNTSTVPFVGDLMASRWAFEAAMVAQFKDNEFEKEFYVYDKTMAAADYKKIYMIPELESRLDFVNLNRSNKEPGIRKEVREKLDLLRTTLEHEEKVTKSGFSLNQDLTLERYDSTINQPLIEYLETLKKFYINRYNKADQEKEKKIEQMTSTPEKEKNFTSNKNAYQNEAITELVRNTMEQNRIIETDGKFVQKIYPIYKDPDPDHMVDFNAQFYMPAKHFLNRNIDTFFFNLGVIWLMTFVLALSLYWEVLRRIIDQLSNISNPLEKRM